MVACRPNPENPGRSFETPSVEPTSDGYVGFNTNTRTQFDSFLLMIERPDLIEAGFWAPISNRIKNWEEWNAIIHDWTTEPAWRPTPSRIRSYVSGTFPGETSRYLLSLIHI